MKTTLSNIHEAIIQCQLRGWYSTDVSYCIPIFLGFENQGFSLASMEEPGGLEAGDAYADHPWTHLV